MSHGITRKDVVLHKFSTCWHALAEVMGGTFDVDEVFKRPAFRFQVALADVALVLPAFVLTGAEAEARVLELAKRFGIDVGAQHPEYVLGMLAELARFEVQPKDKYSLRVDEDGSWLKYGAPVTEAYTHFSQQDAHATILQLQRQLRGELQFSSAGTLFRGARCWVQADLADQDFEITTRLGTKFPHVARFTFMWGHDGQTPVLFFGNDTDICCHNTSEFALREGKARISIPHTSGVHEAVEAAVEVIGNLPGAIDENRRVLQELAELECTEAEFRSFAEAVVLGVTEYESRDERDAKVAVEIMRRRPISEGGEAKTTRALTLFENAVEEYVAEFQRRAYGDGKREPGAGLTLYAADSAISAVIDHPTGVQDAMAEIRAAGGVQEYVKAAKGRYQEAVKVIDKVSRAAESAMLGAGNEVKRRARQMLLRGGGIAVK